MKLEELNNEKSEKITESTEAQFVCTDTKTQKKFKCYAPNAKEARKKAVARFGHQKVSTVKINGQ